MLRSTYIFALTACAIFFGCTSEPNEKAKPEKTVSKNPEKPDAYGEEKTAPEITKVLKLPHGFVLKGGKGEKFGDFTTFYSLKIEKDGTLIYQDNERKEYELDEKPYPVVLKLEAPDAYNILIDMNERPNRNLLAVFRIKNNNVQAIDEIPYLAIHGTDYSISKHTQLPGTMGKPGEIMILPFITLSCFMPLTRRKEFTSTAH